MDKAAKLFIAGHRGLVGSAMWRYFEGRGYSNLIGRSRQELDLTCQAAVERFFEQEKPDYVVLAAAKVGGIHANSVYRADFLYENLMIEANVIHASWRHGVKKLLFLGSSCIYPKLAPQPMKEEALLSAPLEPTNEPYAIAKIAGIRMCDAYNRQYGTHFLSVMPTNMYGPGDHYHSENAHVLPAMIRRMHLAKLRELEDWTGLEKAFSREKARKSTRCELEAWLSDLGIQPSEVENQKSEITVACWGTGAPLREFLYSDDLAEACCFLMENVDGQLLTFEDEAGISQAHVNVGSGCEISIRSLAELVKEVIGFEGSIEWDAARPDGTPRKLMDSSRLRAWGWRPRVALRDGVGRVYTDFLKRYG